MDFTFGKNIAGEPTLQYHCLNCNASLDSKFSDAGNPDTCPECGVGFVTPGKAEITKQKAEIDRALAERDRIQAECEAAKAALVIEVEAKKNAAKQKMTRRLENLKKSMPNLAPHDEATRSPYVYSSVEMAEVSENWSAEFDEITNSMASKGWEFFRTESLTTQRPNGCLAGLFGRPLRQSKVNLLLFRKPAALGHKERTV